LDGVTDCFLAAVLVDDEVLLKRSGSEEERMRLKWEWRESCWNRSFFLFLTGFRTGLRVLVVLLEFVNAGSAEKEEEDGILMEDGVLAFGIL
jgi:hypothetical protein